MMFPMNGFTDRRLTSSCDDCSMRCTVACNECAVTFVLRDELTEHKPLILDLEQARVVRLFERAGMVPDLKFRVAG